MTTVATVLIDPAIAIADVGKKVTLTVAFDTAVTVTGTPTITLNDGGIATYNATETAAAADPTVLIFDYTVRIDDQEVASLQASTINLVGGSTIKDASNNAADLTLAGLVQNGPQIARTVSFEDQSGAAIAIPNPYDGFVWTTPFGNVFSLGSASEFAVYGSGY